MVPTCNSIHMDTYLNPSWQDNLIYKKNKQHNHNHNNKKKIRDQITSGWCALCANNAVGHRLGTALSIIWHWYGSLNYLE